MSHKITISGDMAAARARLGAEISGYEQLSAQIAQATAQALRLRASHDRLLAQLKQIRCYCPVAVQDDIDAATAIAEEV